MPEGTFYRNGVADEMLFVHEGTGVCDTIFGPLRYGPGDYLVMPIGTTWRLEPDAGHRAADPVPRGARPRSSRPGATATTTASCSSTRRTASATSTRPELREPRTRRGRVRHPRPLDRTASRPTTTGTTRSTSSAGTATSGRSGSTSPTSSRSPAASTSRRRSTRRSRRGTSSSARSCPASSTTTRSPSRRRTTTRNINSDEVIYYVAGNFMSRRGVEISSFTVHPAGHPARPAPGHGRGVDRQGGDRGAGGHGRHVPSAAG